MISTHRIKNYLIDDPLLDWLHINGEKNGFTKDPVQPIFVQFLLQKKNNFKFQVFKKLKNLYNYHREIDIQVDIRQRIAQTIDAMRVGYDLIIRAGVFYEFPNKNKRKRSDQDRNIRGWYSIPDILIKADKVIKIIPDLKIDLKQRYVPLDIVFLTLNFNKKGKLLNNRQTRFYKTLSILSQISVNQMTSTYSDTPPQEKAISIILGRSQIRNRENIDYQTTIIEYEQSLVDKSLKALEWIYKINNEKSEKWSLSPPSITELYPNMRYCNEDYPWHETKKQIAKNINDITLLWQCGPQQRIIAHQKGIFDWNSIENPVSDLSMGGKRGKIIDKMITINKETDNVLVCPRKIKNRQNIIQLQQAPLEFYVDFETLQEIDEECEDYSNKNVLFMIGCVSRYKINSNQYHCEYKSFIVSSLSEIEEKRIIYEWIDYMDHFKNLYKNTTRDPPIFHWSPAEPVIYQSLSKKWNTSLRKLEFKDLLQLFQNEPIVVKGAFGYSLKEISKALYGHKCIQTLWNDNVTNGKDAMIQAWMCYQPQHAHEKKEIMGHIEYYNYVDCKVMEEIVTFLRTKL